MLGEGRELRVKLELDPGREEREAFQKPFHVRVGALEGIQTQPPGDLGILGGKLAGHVADVLKFAVVVFEDTGIHQVEPACPRSEI